MLITAPDKKTGRGQKYQPLFIKNVAREGGLKISETESGDTFDHLIREKSPSLVIVAGFGLKIPAKTLPLAKFVNIHPSLLPKYRGSTPIQTAIMEGVEKSGVTLMEMEKEIDSGPIIAKEEVPFHSKITYPEAEELLAKKGGNLLLKTIPSLLKGNEKKVQQNHAKATYTKSFKKEDGKIDWNEPAEVIERKVRALNPWPGTYSKMGSKIFKVLEADIQQQTENGPFGVPGKVYLGTNHTIAVQTGKDFLLIKKLQIEGKKSTSSKDFLQGNMESMGLVLE